MRDEFKQIVEGVSLAADAVGILVIVLGLLIASVQFLVSCWRAADAYRQLRLAMGRTILLGLEFLVAADIIRTVAVDPTLETVVVLGLIVVIRTFLSMAIEVELEGVWPWQRTPLSTGDNKPAEIMPKDDSPIGR